MDEKIQLLIGKSGNKDVQIDAQELVTGRTCVIGQSGSGKSYLIAVLCEKLLEKNIAFCIIDTEGEYFSLKEKFDVLWVGGQESDVNIEGVNLQDLIEKSISNNMPIILDVSDVLDQRKLVTEFSSKLYQLESEQRQPYVLIVEEADKFVPQSKDSLKEIEEISKRGRKRGLGLLVATQRPSLVNKNVLSQCGNQLIGKLTTENDLKAVDLFFANRKELEDLPKLEPGEFFAMGNISKEKIKMKSVQRITQHKGLTPKLVKKSQLKIEQIKSSIKVESQQKSGSFGLLNKITKEDAEKIAESNRKKKHILFGEKEHIKSIDLEYVPLINVEIKVVGGFLNKKPKTHSFLLDSEGNLVEIENGLKTKQSLSQFLSLEENEIKALHQFSKSKKLTAEEVALKIKISESTARKTVSSLEDKKFLTFKKEGNSRIYFPLVDLDFPDLKRDDQLPLMENSPKGEKPKIAEEQVKNFVKAVYPADVTKFFVFFYPIWKVGIGKREIKIDGIKGNVLDST